MAGLVGILMGATGSAIVSGYVANQVKQSQIRNTRQPSTLQARFDARQAAYSRVLTQVASFELTESQFEVDVYLSRTPSFDGFDVIGMEDSLAMEISVIEVSASPSVQADAANLLRLVDAQLVSMARLASTRRAAKTPISLSQNDLDALAVGQMRVSNAMDTFLKDAGNDLGPVLS